MIGRVVHDRYEIVERISEGPLFQCFKARDHAAGRVVSIKFLQAVYAHDSAFADALQRSALETVSLAHPNIASVIEVGKDDGEPYVVGEYVRGIDLKERVRRVAPFTLSVAVEIAIAIAEALQCAHAAGICHGDLRPQHVTVTAEGAVKVADFGMGAALAASPQAHAANLAQAAYYQAPEVATGVSASISMDIYALGVILFEMVTGGVPYPGETPVSVAMKHQSEPTPSPRSLNPGVPRALEGIVLKAMQKRPADRYISCGDMLSDLRSVRDALRFGKPLSWTPTASGAPAVAAAPKPPEPLPGLPSLPEKAAAGPRMQAPMDSNADDQIPPILKVAIYSLVAVLVMVVIIGGAYWFASQSRPPDRRAPNLVGMKLDDARKALEGLGARIMTHEEFDDKTPAGVILRADVDPGQMVRATQRINVWVSKGSRMVWVPDLTKLPKDDAVSKLSDAGLSLGEVDLQNSDTVPMGAVIAQKPRAGRRVERNSPVSLTLSDGPKEPQAEPAPDASAPDAGSAGGSGYPSDTETLSPASPDAAGRADTFEFRVHVKRDGRGLRRVRIVCTDALGTSTVFDDMRSEGEDIRQSATVHGDRVRVRVYYGEDAQPVSDRIHNLGSGQ
jgi:serine/threonine-protein kinase